MRKWPVVAVVLCVATGAFLWIANPLLRHPIVLLQLLRAAPPAHLPVPVRGITPRQLHDSWGAPRSGGRQHRGIDIFAPRNREILSATRGIVITVGHNELGGRVVRVLGPGGYWHYYAHLERYGPIHPGQVVESGTILGYVGDSGNARGTPTHLHYGIYRLRGGAMNPYTFLENRL